MFTKNYTTVALFGKLQNGKMASIFLVKIKLKILILNKLSISLPKLWIAFEEKPGHVGLGASITALTSTLAAAQEP